jgi:hypothetical protein
MADLPKMVHVRQQFSTDQIDDLAGTIRAELTRVGLEKHVGPGMEVAITAGSRGITRIPEIIRTVADAVKAAGASPFIVPAMGSHGGAVAEGQASVLRDYGITEEATGAPVRATMDVVDVGTTANGATVFIDRNAFHADAVIVVARVKPHTSFRGPVESGLCKMIAVGLGKQKGAEQMHAHGLGETIPQAAAIAIENSNIVMGLGVVENGYDQPHTIRAALAADIYAADKEMQTLSKTLLPRVPFDELDLLIVDVMGKNISGAGMDPNVIGLNRGMTMDRHPNYKRVLVRDLTPESHGNSVGIGHADFVTKRLADKINYYDLYMNALTANNPAVAKIPITLENDRVAIETAFKSACTDVAEPRVARIYSTLHLEYLLLSEALIPAVRENPNLEILDAPYVWEFDGAGNLVEAGLLHQPQSA